MKKIVMILMMMITFVGFASNKPKDNFDYDKYVGYYVDTEYDFNDKDYVNNDVELLIKKDKNGEYALVDYRMYYGSGFSRTRTINVIKLNKINGTLQNKNRKYVFILKNNLLLFDDGKYRKIDNKMGEKWFNESELTCGVKYKIFK